MPITTLVVDDFEPFRRYVKVTLAQRAEVQVIGEAADGLEAIQKAQELQPDLILLDLGLPKMNGLQAALRLRKVAPNAKILFLSQEFAFDLVEAALRSGAVGYLHKTRAHSELPAAIDAVLQGKYFVSGILSGDRGDVRNEKRRIRHEVQFYSDDTVLVESFSNFIAAALRAGKAAIVVATESHRAGILQGLTGKGVDVDAAVKTGTLVPLDVMETLSAFKTTEMPDPNRFFDIASALVEAAAKVATTEGAARVAVCGECAPLLLMGGNVTEALRVEQLWHLLAHRFIVDMLCGYPSAAFEKDSEIFRSICAEHSAIHSFRTD